MPVLLKGININILSSITYTKNTLAELLFWRWNISRVVVFIYLVFLNTSHICSSVSTLLALSEIICQRVNGRERSACSVRLLRVYKQKQQHWKLALGNNLPPCSLPVRAPGLGAWLDLLQHRSKDTRTQTHTYTRTLKENCVVEKI